MPKFSGKRQKYLQRQKQYLSKTPNVFLQNAKRYAFQTFDRHKKHTANTILQTAGRCDIENANKLLSGTPKTAQTKMKTSPERHTTSNLLNVLTTPNVE